MVPPTRRRTRKDGLSPGGLKSLPTPRRTRKPRATQAQPSIEPADNETPSTQDPSQPTQAEPEPTSAPEATSRSQSPNAAESRSESPPAPESRSTSPPQVQSHNTRSSTEHSSTQQSAVGSKKRSRAASSPSTHQGVGQSEDAPAVEDRPAKRTRTSRKQTAHSSDDDTAEDGHAASYLTRGRMVTEPKNGGTSSDATEAAAQPASMRSRSKSTSRQAATAAAQRPHEGEGSSSAPVTSDQPPTTTSHTNQNRQFRRYRTPKTTPFRREPSPIELSPRPGDSSPLILPDDPDERQDLFHKMYNVPNIAKNPKCLDIFNTGLETYGPKQNQEEEELSDDGLGFLDGPDYTRDAFKKHRNDPKTFRRDAFPHNLPPQSTDKIEAERKRRATSRATSGSRQTKLKAVINEHKQSQLLPSEGEMPATLTEAENSQNAISSTPERHSASQQSKGKSVFRGPNASQRYEYPYTGLASAEAEDQVAVGESEVNQVEPRTPEPEQETQVKQSPSWFQTFTSTINSTIKIPFKFIAGGISASKPTTTNDTAGAANPYDFNQPATPTPAGNRPRGLAQTERKRRQQPSSAARPHTERRKRHSDVPLPPIHLRGVLTQEQIAQRHREQDMVAERHREAERQKQRARAEDKAEAESEAFGQGGSARTGDKRSRSILPEIPGSVLKNGVAYYPRRPGLFVSPGYHIDSDSDSEDEDAEATNESNGSPTTTTLPPSSRDRGIKILNAEESQAREALAKERYDKGERRNLYRPSSPPGDHKLWHEMTFKEKSKAIAMEPPSDYPFDSEAWVRQGWDYEGSLHGPGSEKPRPDYQEILERAQAAYLKRLPPGVVPSEREERDNAWAYTNAWYYNRLLPTSVQDQLGEMKGNIEWADKKDPFKQYGWVQANLDAKRDPLTPGFPPTKDGGNIFNEQGQRKRVRFEAPDPNAPDSDEDEAKEAVQEPAVSNGVLEQKQWSQTPPPKAPRPVNAQLPQLSNLEVAKPTPLTPIEKEKMRLMNAPREPSRLRNMTTQMSSPVTQDNQLVQTQVESQEENEENQPPFENYVFSREIQEDVERLDLQINALIANHLPVGYVSIFARKTALERSADRLQETFAKEGLAAAKMQAEVEGLVAIE